MRTPIKLFINCIAISVMIWFMYLFLNEHAPYEDNPVIKNMEILLIIVALIYFIIETMTIAFNKASDWLYNKDDGNIHISRP